MDYKFAIHTLEGVRLVLDARVTSPIETGGMVRGDMGRGATPGIGGMGVVEGKS